MIGRRGFLAGIFAAGAAPALMLHAPAMRLWTPELVLPEFNEWFMTEVHTDTARLLMATNELLRDMAWLERNPPVTTDGQMVRVRLPARYMRSLDELLRAEVKR